jgi:hypothetical protein
LALAIHSFWSPIRGNGDLDQPPIDPNPSSSIPKIGLVVAMRANVISAQYPNRSIGADCYASGQPGQTHPSIVDSLKDLTLAVYSFWGPIWGNGDLNQSTINPNPSTSVPEIGLEVAMRANVIGTQYPNRSIGTDRNASSQTGQKHPNILDSLKYLALAIDSFGGSIWGNGDLH